MRSRQCDGKANHPEENVDLAVHGIRECGGYLLSISVSRQPIIHLFARNSMSSRSSLYQQIIEPIEDRLIRTAWRITRNAADAEDAIQEALVIIWKRRHRLTVHASPQALVLKICVDAACDVARRRARYRRLDQAQTAPEEPDDGGHLALDDLAQRELAREIQLAINRLSRLRLLPSRCASSKNCPMRRSPWP